jgi:thiamine-phosphate diphosphorylase
MPKQADFSLYLITNRQGMGMEQFETTLEETLLGGVTIVQLREKMISDTEYIMLAKKIKPMLVKYNVPLIINDNPYVAKEAGADGVHLGQKDHDVEQARQLLGQQAIIGLSIEKTNQAKHIDKLPIDYAAISPIFNTDTKKDISTPLGIENAKMIRKMVKKDLLAIGGINISNVAEVLSTGIDGVCIISAIFNDSDPRLAAQKLKEKIIHHRRYNYA